VSYIPEAVREFNFDRKLSAAGHKLLNQGKVRHTYSVPDLPYLMLSVATDRISINDFVLGSTIEKKGAVLTSTTVHWLISELTGISHHLVAYGTAIDKFLLPGAKKDPDLRSRTLVVRKLDMFDLECVGRGYITGSMYKEYRRIGFDQTGGMLWGHLLPPGLKDGSELPEAIFTPTTKAQTGHDEPLDWREVRKKYGLDPEMLTLHYYTIASRYARARGIILADTKFEFGTHGERALVLGDEVLTPDSSRFWDAGSYSESIEKGKTPTSHDKQYVRDYGKGIKTPFSDGKGAAIVGIGNLDPANPEHQQFVGSLTLPPEVSERTTGIYLGIHDKLTGRHLPAFA